METNKPSLGFRPKSPLFLGYLGCTVPNMSLEREVVKSLIEERFETFVKGLRPDLSLFNSLHDGAEGDWLTKKMGLTVNGKNEPDFLGFEMKKDSRKTSFGDWAPDIALYKSRGLGIAPELPRVEFLKIFGTPKVHREPRKNGRYSWSGEVFPTVKGVNKFGQVMRVERTGDISATYRYEMDKRQGRDKLIPTQYRRGEIILAKWTNEKLKSRLERKFNQLGWFKCIKDSSGCYSHLQFGKPINYENFLSLVVSGDIFCDCGMYDGNSRPYMTWRASHRVWDLLTEDA